MSLSRYRLLGLLILVLTTAGVSGLFSSASAQSNYQVLLPLVITEEPPAIQPTFTFYRLPEPVNLMYPVAAGHMQWGPDGNLWFAGDVSFYRYAPLGKLTRYAIGTRAGIEDFVIGPDGNFWWPRAKLEPGRVIEKFTPTGVLSTVLNLDGKVEFYDITVGPDNALWFPINRLQGQNAIGRLTTAGQFTELPLTLEAGYLRDITTGPDGNLWVTTNGDGSIVEPDSVIRITPAGTMTRFLIPTLKSDPRKIIAGPDGNLWFLEYAANQVVRITPDGLINEYPVPTPESRLYDIIAAPDGNVWFTESTGNKIGRITPHGSIAEFEVPDTGCQANEICGYPSGLALGPDGHLWFGTGFYRIGRLDGIFPTEK